MPPIELNTDYQSAHRFPGWIALSIFSAVCVAAEAAQSSGYRTGSDKWVLAVMCLSMILSAIATAGYLLMRSIFVGQVFEIGILAIVLSLWGTGLPVLMNPANEIAVTPGPIVQNANLYFFSWVSFAIALFLTGSMAQETAGIDVRQLSPRVTRWYGLTASSLVVMGSAIRVFKTSECMNAGVGGQSYCKRTKLALSMGVISFFLAAVMTFAISLDGVLLDAIIELILTSLLLAFWTFGVGYITFGDSPGSTISNLYFASWICFIMSTFLFGTALREFLSGGQPSQNGTGNDEQQNHHPANPEHGDSPHHENMPVEDL